MTYLTSTIIKPNYNNARTYISFTICRTHCKAHQNSQFLTEGGTIGTVVFQMM